MGNAHVLRGRLTPALVIAAVLALALLAVLAIAGTAAAQPAFEPTCGACHTEAAVHPSGYPSAGPSANPNHAGLACSKCHTNGTATPPPTSACGSCHGGVTAILAKTTHSTQSCGTTVGCHGYTGVTQVATVLTAKAAPTTVKVGKTVTISGTATPADQLTGAKIAILVNRKVGTKWVKAKAATATASATGSYSWKYKVAKKGSYQVKVSVKATATFTAKSVTKTFKAK
jgi:hypothetical protein